MEPEKSVMVRDATAAGALRKEMRSRFWKEEIPSFNLIPSNWRF
jgi:hypothetical protein